MKDGYGREWAGWPVGDAAEGLARWALDCLPRRYRVPLWLRCGEGMDAGEVAAVLSVPEATARRRVTRGLALLQACLLFMGMRRSRASLGVLLRVAPTEQAPARLLGRIGGLVREASRAAA